MSPFVDNSLTTEVELSMQAIVYLNYRNFRIPEANVVDPSAGQMRPPILHPS